MMMILILTVMRYLDLEDSGSGIRSELLINFCRLLTITSFSLALHCSSIPPKLALLNHVSP